MMLRQTILEWAEEYFAVAADHPFSGITEAEVLRRPDNRKWFGLLMSVPADRLGFGTNQLMDILNVKCDPNLSGSLRLSPGFLPAYHMNKESWISILLDGSVPLEQIQMLLNLSYDLTAPKRNKKGTI